jgi:hypothetical protein
MINNLKAEAEIMVSFVASQLHCTYILQSRRWLSIKVLLQWLQ